MSLTLKSRTSEVWLKFDGLMSIVDLQTCAKKYVRLADWDQSKNEWPFYSFNLKIKVKNVNDLDIVR